MFLRLLLLLASSCLTTLGGNLVSIQDCTLVPQEWADGDSFQVMTPKGVIHTVRLYGADCLESTVTNTTDARRLRAQRRYFGITDTGGSAQASIALAKKLGDDATKIRKELVAKPFTIWTSYADARGDRRYKRIYAFVILNDGRDLSSVLVEQGLARAYGVYRSAWNGNSGKDYQANLKDLEIIAAKKGRGIWDHTDWDRILQDRQTQREEDRLISIALDNKKLPTKSVDINKASRDELMQLPGIGETMANRIIEGRPFRKPEDLLKVSGIGKATFKKLLPYLSNSETPTP